MRRIGALPWRRPMLSFDGAALGRLLPMHLRLDSSGRVLGHGPLIGRLDATLVGARLFDRFTVLRPSGAVTLPDLVGRAGGRVKLVLNGADPVALRGLAVPAGDGALVNLTLGIGAVDAVRRFALTEADFAPTDLTVEMLYLVEANRAVQAELRSLNFRLQGARDLAEADAMTDPLTGLANRRALEHALARACAGAGAFVLLHLDLDHFKAVNDWLGHAAGDHVLREVAQVLRAETRAEDVVARIGGDEFVVLMTATGDADTALRIAGRIIDGISAPLQFDGQSCAVAASVGVALSGAGRYPDPAALLRQADEALYTAKRAGRACAVLADPV